MKWNNVQEENEALKEKAAAVVSIKSEQPQNENTKTSKDHDIKSGLEMLDIVFVLGVVDTTDSADPNDITMRKIGFNEILRRDSRPRISSDALKVYALDQNKFYGKDIQCQAMQELAERTTSH
ncbi:MAG: hypothetical protein KAJ07_03390 [Planctomycetes bacterium]|nr:hypothetical protein [Planctomycetota bacterium]